jgi:hypothetical protein
MWSGACLGPYRPFPSPLPQILHKMQGYPQQYSVVIGIAIGYEDKAHRQSIQKRRRPVEEVAFFKGFIE